MSLKDVWCYLFPWLCVNPVPTPDPNPTPIPVPSPQPDPIPNPPPTPTPVPQDINSQFLVLINQLRMKEGVGKTAINPRVVAVAQSWSDAQAKDDTMSHGDFQSRINSVYPNTYAAENVAEGSSDVSGTFNQWVNSPPHYQNMIGNYTSIGLGMSKSSQGNHYWTLDLVRV